MEKAVTKSITKGTSLVVRFADRFGVDAAKLLPTLKATAFKQRDGSVPTDEQMMALIVVADQYNLNPFTREIYAFPDKQNGIVPVVGADGWSRIINEHPKLDGIEFAYADELVQPTGARSKCPAWIECVLYRKDRTQPIRVREYLDEAYREPFQKKGQTGSYSIDGPWQSHPKRMLRHKALIQCARIAFGFTGIYEPEEAENIRDMGDAVVIDANHGSIDYKTVDALVEKIAAKASLTNAWSAAYELIKQRLSREAEREYGLTALCAKEEAYRRAAQPQTGNGEVVPPEDSSTTTETEEKTSNGASAPDAEEDSLQGLF